MLVTAKIESRSSTITWNKACAIKSIPATFASLAVNEAYAHYSWNCRGKCPKNKTLFSLLMYRSKIHSGKLALQLVASSAIKIHLSFYFWYLLNHSSIHSPWSLYLLMANTIVPHNAPPQPPQLARLMKYRGEYPLLALPHGQSILVLPKDIVK